MGTKQKQQGGEPGAQLDTLAVEIRREHEAVEAGARSTVEAAIRCGNLLRDAKTKVGHGGWMDWLATNFPASDRTARAYMRLADRYANRQLPASLTIDGALKQLAAPPPRRGGDAADLLGKAKEHIAAGDDYYQRAFEEMFKGFAERGIKFHATGIEFPDDLSIEEWQEVGQALAAMPTDRLEALSPKTRWDLEDVLGRVSEAISQENEVEEAEMEDGDTEGWPGD